jgi:hypothetical protein
MKIPFFAGKTLSEFIKSATLVTSQGDGSKLNVYGIEVATPGFCLGEDCNVQMLRRNGSYTRQVIEGLMFVLVLIYRFRCGLCGKTVSRPYSFLVPYRRFTAKLICRGIEMYGGEEETSYDEISTELSVFVPESDDEAEAAPVPDNKTTSGKAGFCPARSTMFSWVDFTCKRITKIVQQVEKELVLRNIFDMNLLSGESQFLNKNDWKAGNEMYPHQKDKPAELNRLSYGLASARLLTGSGQDAMQKLRAYFLESAEKCADLLSDVLMVLPITHSSDQQLW